MAADDLAQTGDRTRRKNKSQRDAGERAAARTRGRLAGMAEAPGVEGVGEEVPRPPPPPGLHLPPLPPPGKQVAQGLAGLGHQQSPNT